MFQVNRHKNPMHRCDLNFVGDSCVIGKLICIIYDVLCMYSIVFGCPLECLSLGINRLIYCCISMS